MLFEPKHFGKPISVELSDYLRQWTTKEDLLQVFETTQVSVKRLQAIMYRKRKLTSANAEGVIRLMELAIRNCTHKIQYAKKSERVLKSMLYDKKRTCKI